MKSILILMISCLTYSCLGQSINSSQTTQHGGIYAWKSKVVEDQGGVVYVYPETNTSILFYMELNRGAPSYNMGQLEGRVKVSNGTGVFFNSSFPGSDCKFSFTFVGEQLIVKTIEDKYDCMFGAGVVADGTLTRISTKIPEYFEGYEGKVYFKNIKPDDNNPN